jgi:hypothetical protein
VQGKRKSGAGEDVAATSGHGAAGVVTREFPPILKIILDTIEIIDG